MLEIRNLETGYGKKQVLFGVSLEVREGEVVALIGPNGAGKSTILKTAYGLIPAWNGDVQFSGVIINGSTPARNVARGMTLCPQGNRVFGDMTVRENLEIGGYQLSSEELEPRISDVLCLFPVLRERLKQDAGKLSGGEQQMLSLARALVPKPKLLMLDEPSLGLSPNLVAAVFERIIKVNRETGVAVLIVEQKLRDVLRIAGRVYGLRLGQIAAQGTPDQIAAGDNLKRLFLG
jgi:branched-chain amino acid transport system ATP-binding protein